VEIVRSNLMLRTGDPLPHFNVTALDGQRVAYAAIWQRKIVVLVLLPEVGSTPPPVDVQTFAAEMQAAGGDAECVITRDRVDGVPCPGAVVADRWGEVVHVASTAGPGELPDAQDLIEWVEHVRNRCPECEGEAK
jgi:hypothetical protein